MSAFNFAGRAGFPLGPKRRALLGRVYLEGGVYRCRRNVDREIADGMVALGLIRRDARDREVLTITETGRIYHEQTVRAV